MTKPDPQFVRDFNESHGPVLSVATWLRKQGHIVRIPAPLLRPNFDVRWEYVDHGDIELTRIVEVKRKFLHFTCADDFPHPNLRVDERHKIDQLQGKSLMGYVLTNEEVTHAAYVPMSTRPRWVPEDEDNRYQRRMVHWYACPKELATFFQL